MANVEIYTTQVCPYCIRAKMLFDRKGIRYTELRVDIDSELRALMEQRSGRRTVPQIFIDNRHIGGCDDLYALEAQHKLDTLLQ